VLPPFLLLLNVSLNTAVAFLLVLERVEKYWRRTKRLAAKVEAIRSRELA
jgi:hypothetical protein